MAPIRARKHPTKSKAGRSLPSSGNSILHTVQGGRLGRKASVSRRTVQSKKSAAQLNADLYWKGRTPAKELFPNSLSQQAQNHAPSSITQQQNAGKELLPDLLQPSDKMPAKKTVLRRPHKPTGKAAYLKNVNIRQSRIHRAKDAIAKRTLALQAVEYGRSPQDLRDEQTVPYNVVRLDLDPTSGPSKLLISISCGFWGYAPIFSPTKVFTFSLENFTTPSRIQKAIFNARDIHEAGKQVGIDTHEISIAVVAYEVVFPKGYRYNSVDHANIKNNTPITYVSADSEVLVNTPCALREFFLQSRNHACDVFGNVSIPVTARIGRIAPDPLYGRLSATQLDADWRSDEEKKCAAEEKRLSLEQQQFADANQKLMIRKKMETIQAKAEQAVLAHQASMTGDQMDPNINITTDALCAADRTEDEPEIEEFLMHVGFGKPSEDNGELLDNDDLISIDLNIEESEKDDLISIDLDLNIEESENE